jgi:membrane dipeptidase
MTLGKPRRAFTAGAGSGSFRREAAGPGMTMDGIETKASALHAAALVWDSHTCMPLHPDADMRALRRHKAAGADFVSVNIGMDMNPIGQIMAVIASFRAQLKAMPDLFVLASTAADIERASADGRLAVAFDLEGGVPLGDRPEMVGLFYDLGVRQVHLAYNRNNAIGGGCYDTDIPLTAFGRKVVAAINAAGMLMDCSHTGHRTSLDIMEVSTAPVFFSHSNARALVDDPRNVTDEQIHACVATGGLIAVNGVSRFLGDRDGGADAILRHIDYLVQMIGPEHVGLGIDSVYHQGLEDLPRDCDRAFWWPGYANGPRVTIAPPERLPEITEGLVRMAYSEDAIRRILGQNMLDLARKVWRPAP